MAINQDITTMPSLAQQGNIVGPSPAIEAQTKIPFEPIDYLGATISNAWSHLPTVSLARHLAPYMGHAAFPDIPVATLKEVQQKKDEVRNQVNAAILSEGAPTKTDSAVAWGADMVTGVLDPLTLAAGVVTGGISKVAGKITGAALGTYAPKTVDAFSGFADSFLGTTAKHALSGGVIGAGMSVPSILTSMAFSGDIGEKYNASQAWDSLKSNFFLGSVLGGFHGGMISIMRKAAHDANAGAQATKSNFTQAQSDVHDKLNTQEGQQELEKDQENASEELKKATDAHADAIAKMNEVSKKQSQGGTGIFPLDATTEAMLRMRALAKDAGDREDFENRSLEKLQPGYQTKLIDLLKKGPYGGDIGDAYTLSHFNDLNNEADTIGARIDPNDDDVAPADPAALEARRKEIGPLDSSVWDRNVATDRLLSHSPEQVGIDPVDGKLGVVREPTTFNFRRLFGKGAEMHEAYHNYLDAGDRLDDAREQVNLLTQKQKFADSPPPNPLAAARQDAAQVVSDALGEGQGAVNNANMDALVAQKGKGEDEESAREEDVLPVDAAAEKEMKDYADNMKSMEGHENDIARTLAECVAK